ncbi:MFS transporter [Nocardiopsis metallicus]|uniref:MFS family permease n=1 Tax=Nocardiopsis metallicus TaxID=179819 RepID=A0A840W9K3_9ACTN|nr:MFS transporter [Nocardiopsis metallicus]MBB5493689.1 MFS family permease [Nocardiopsis metallicus]
MTTTSSESTPESACGPFASAGFRRFFAARTMADTGTEVGALAMPLLAVLTLDATPGQVGLLGALTTAAYLIIGLPAGVWTDRFRRRPVIVVSQFLHGLILLSIPLAWALGALTLTQLYVCALLGGAAALFSRIAQQGFLPALVGRDRLLPANAALTGLQSTSILVGRGSGGYLVQFLGAPAVLLLNGLAQCASSLVTAAVRVQEPEPERSERRLLAQIREGARYVFGHEILRPVAASTLIVNLGLSPLIVLAPVLIVTDLGLSEGRAGLFFMVGAVGVLLGSMVSTRLAVHLGTGRTLVLSSLVTGVGALAVPFLTTANFWAVSVVWALSQLGIGTLNVVQVTLRQQVTPDRMIGRMTATLRFLMTGALTIGALYAGAVAELWDVRAALAVGAAVSLLGWIPLALSRLRGPDPQGGYGSTRPG